MASEARKTNASTIPVASVDLRSEYPGCRFGHQVTWFGRPGDYTSYRLLQDAAQAGLLAVCNVRFRLSTGSSGIWLFISGDTLYAGDVSNSADDASNSGE